MVPPFRLPRATLLPDARGSRSLAAMEGASAPDRHPTRATSAKRNPGSTLALATTEASQADWLPASRQRCGLDPVPGRLGAQSLSRGRRAPGRRLGADAAI